MRLRMQETERLLIIDIGDIYAYSTILLVAEGDVSVAKQDSHLVSLSVPELTQAIQENYRGEYDRVKVVDDTRQALSAGVKQLSADGEVVYLLVDANQSWICHSSFGRVKTMQELPFGVGMGIDSVMSPSGVNYISAWCQMQHDSQELTRAFDFLGRRTLYPTLLPEQVVHEHAILGLLRYIFKQTVLEQYDVITHEDSPRSMGARKLIIGGGILDGVSQFGAIVLGILDEFGLTGIWELYIDPTRYVVSKGLLDEGAIFNEVSPVQLLSTVIVLEYSERQGEALGNIMVDSGLSVNQEVIIRSGELIRLPTVSDGSSSLELDLKPSVFIRGFNGNNKLRGGALGLVLDARGRPLPSFTDNPEYRKHFDHWMEALTLVT